MPKRSSPPREARQRPPAALRQAQARLRKAEAAAQRAWTRLETSPDTLEYQVDFQVARREEATAATRLREAQEIQRPETDSLPGPGSDLTGAKNRHRSAGES